VRYDGLRPETLQLGGKSTAHERHAAVCAVDERTEFGLDHWLTRCDTNAASRRNASLTFFRVDPRLREAIDLIARRMGTAQPAQQELVLDQALQHSLGPAEHLVARVHAQRGIDVEQQRLEFLRVQQRATPLSPRRRADLPDFEPGPVIRVCTFTW